VLGPKVRVRVRVGSGSGLALGSGSGLEAGPRDFEKGKKNNKDGKHYGFDMNLPGSLSG